MVRETRKDEVTSTNQDEQCPFCFGRNIETIIISMDRNIGMMRCPDCHKRMRIGDYKKWILALKIRDGGRL